MKRGGDLPRRKVLERGKPIAPGTKGLQRHTSIAPGAAPQRRSGMPRSGLPQPEGHAPRKPTAKKPGAGRAPMPKWLADYVLERAEGLCDRCARPLSELGFSRQHRRAHGMGGRAGAELHTAANVVVLCGSATTPGSCHNLAENAERAQCEREGWVIRGEVIRPEEHPVLRHGRELVIPTGQGWLPAPTAAS